MLAAATTIHGLPTNLPHCAQLVPRRAAFMTTVAARSGERPVQNHRAPVGLFPKLATQLVPAAVVTALGVLLLSNLSKAPAGVSVTPAPAAITAEAVFTATPRPVEQQPVSVDDAVLPVAKPKAVALRVVPPARKPADEARQVEQPRQAASVSAPLAIVQLPPQVQTPVPEPTMMGRVWGATASVATMPIRAARSVTGWFDAAVPPRPPASVPLQEFQAAM